MPKIYVIYNIAGISGRDINNVDHYIECLGSITEQEMNDCSYQIIVSACCNNSKVLDKLDRYFTVRENGRITKFLSILDIHDKLPVNTTFNYAVMRSEEEFGRADAFLYVDSGIKFTAPDQLMILWNLMNSGPYSMVAAMTDDDGGYDQWFNDQLPDGDYFKIPVGKAVNMHCQLFSRSILDYYNRVWPDIFAGHCSESVLTFVAAAIKTNWVISKKVVVNHARSVDGPSSGFDPAKWVQQGKSRFDHPFIIESIIPRIMGIFPWGGGYEGDYIKHNPAHFDENGFCKNTILKQAIKENLFLQPNEFDYNKVNAEWV